MTLFRLVCAGTLLGGLSLASVQAEVVFQADFNSTSDVVTTGGDPSENPDGVYTVKVRSNTTVDLSANATPLAGGEGGYLNITRAANVDDPGNAGPTFAPVTDGNWFNAWYTDNGANDALVGAVDFLYRQNTDYSVNNTFRLDFPAAAGSNGLRLVLSTRNPRGSDDADQLFLLINQQTASGTTTLGQKANFFTEGPVFEANQTYHIAIVAEEAEGSPGQYQVKVFMEKGDVPIDTRQAALFQTDPFTIDPDDELTQSFSTDDPNTLLGISRLDAWDGFEGEVNVDFDRFRVFDDVPDFIVPEPSSVFLFGPGLLCIARRRCKRA